MKLSDLPDIEFVSADEQEILSDIIKLYTEITGRTLAQGDPVRLFLCVIATIILMLCNKINYTGKQNLLRYSAGANLDHLGSTWSGQNVLAPRPLSRQLKYPVGGAVRCDKHSRRYAGDSWR